jgi:hypothetical protein
MAITLLSTQSSVGPKVAVETQWSGTPSWWIYFGRIFLTFFFTAAAITLAFTDLEYKESGSAVCALIALTLFLSACWSKFSNRYRISRGAISASFGLLSIEIHEIDVRDLKDLVLKQSLAGRVLNYGTLEFSSAGRDKAEVIFAGVPNPTGVKDFVTELRRATPASREGSGTNGP